MNAVLLPTILTATILCLLLCATAVQAQHTIRGEGRYNNSPMLLMDRKTPAQGTAWNSDQCVWWNTKETNFVINIGAGRTLNDVRIQVDADDTYKVEISLDGQTWTLLFTILPEYGEIAAGMDTFCTTEGDPDYVKEIDFTPIRCMMIRISAEGGDGNYAAAEIRPSSSIEE